MNRSEGILEWQDLGVIPYREAWELQERLRDERVAGNIADRILLLEHKPVITMGRKECSADVVSPEAALAADGIELVKSNRGGRATYHGPGQLICYFICELTGFHMGIKDFVAAIEEASIRTLADFGVRCERDAAHPGLWVGRDKIVAIGLNVEHNVTQHGLAMNVNCDLGAYRHIIACGIHGRGITSVEKLTREAPRMHAVKERFIARSGEVFKRKLLQTD